MWGPILDGAQASVARAAVLDIARSIAAEHPPARPGDLAVFWAYVAGVVDEPWVNERYEAAVDALVATFTGAQRPQLFGGLAGNAWALAHICDPAAAEDILGHVDRVLVEQLPQLPDYDLIAGLVGLGVYFLERGDGLLAREGRAIVKDQLRARALQTPDGLTWHTPPELLPPHQRAAAPLGQRDCGVAHGVPGAAAMLARLGDRAGAADALRWLASCALPGAARYPTVIVDGASRGPSRSAWCYGDPGVAIAAWGAAARSGLPTEPWQELARVAAARPFADTGVNDPMICHGSAGLAHVFNRGFQASGDLVLRDAARAYLARTLAMRSAEGFAGFARAVPTDAGYVWRPDAGLLEGATGVALVLLAAIEPAVPAWDRLLLCDILPDAGDATES